MWSVDDAVQYALSHARDRSLGRCAEFTRRAIEAGGVTLIRHRHAKDYGVSLQQVGFARLPTSETDNEPGDVAIISAIDDDESGHMCMFTGKKWVSDFIQKTMFPGSEYRKAQPPYVIYRMQLREDLLGTGLVLKKSEFDED